MFHHQTSTNSVLREGKEMSATMEATVGCGKDRRGSRDEREGPSLGFGSHFGSCSSTPPSSPPHKLFRTAAFPFRMEQPPVCFSGCTFHPSTLRPQVAAALQAPVRTGWPFTPSQWQELQRQALIYKHLMSSVPVPSDLLHPISARSFPSSPNLMSVAGGCYTLRIGNKIDPEPGRCRRTDGKKWRCSNEVAMEQKYCERHMHRGRPRSRKPVEQPKDKANPTKTPAAIEEIKPKALPAQPPAFFIDPSKEPRHQEWMKSRGEEVAPKNQWGSINSDIDSGFQLNLNYSNLNSHCTPYTEDGGFGDDGRTPRSFIDAWSTEISIPTTTSSTSDKMFPVLEGRKLPLSTLSLSMPSGVEEWIDMGLGIRNNSMDVKEPQVNWMGGPLAEVLGRSNNGGLIDLMSKSRYGSVEASPQESPASPSGVLRKTLVSLSDSSSCSSPTFGGGGAKPELALQWFK